MFRLLFISEHPSFDGAVFSPLEGLAVAFEKHKKKQVRKMSTVSGTFLLAPLGSASNAAYLQARHTGPELISGTVRQHCQHRKIFTHSTLCVCVFFYCGIPPSGAPQSFFFVLPVAALQAFPPLSSAIQWQFFIALDEILQPSSSSSSWPGSWQKRNAPQTPLSGGGFREQMIVKHEIVLL